VNNTISSPNVTSGVPQGSGSTLFLLYINDLVDCIKHIQITLFAEDLKINNTSDKQAFLKQDLENLSFWAKKWQMSISLTKTNVLYLGNSNPKSDYSLDNVFLEDAGDSCKDLGCCRTISLCVVISKTLFQRGLRYLPCCTEVLYQETRGDCQQHFRIPKPRTDLKKFDFRWIFKSKPWKIQRNSKRW